MTEIKPECNCRSTDKKIPVHEKRSKVLFHNPERYEVQKIEVDGCVVPEDADELRCDYLLLVDDADVSVFVELKGSDIVHAVEQLKASSKKLSEHCKTNNFWIICSTRCPLIGTVQNGHILSARKNFNAKLTIKNIFAEHTFSKPPD